MFVKKRKRERERVELNWTYFIDINKKDWTQVQKLSYKSSPRLSNIVYIKAELPYKNINIHCLKFHTVFLNKNIYIYAYIHDKSYWERERERDREREREKGHEDGLYSKWER